MSNFRKARSYWLFVPIFAAVILLGVANAQLNPKALAYKLPNQIQWTSGLAGADQAVLRGDLSKPGP